MKVSPTKIKEVMAGKGITPQQLAFRLGQEERRYVGLGQVNNWLSGKHTPNANTMIQICLILGVDIKEVCE